MPALLDDMRQAFRLLRRDPRFTAAALATIALGVGVNTAIFGVADALLFRPMPFREPGRLVAIWNEQGRISWPELEDLRHQRMFEAVAAYTYQPNFVSFAGPGADSESVTRVLVAGGFFEVLGRRPLLGRTFTGQDFRPAARNADPLVPSAILSYHTWQTSYGGRGDILGQIIRIDGDPHPIIGVMPPDFRLFRSDRPEVFLPLQPPQQHLSDRRRGYLDIVARLRTGTTIDSARTELANLSRAYRIDGLHDRFFGKLRPVVLLVMGAVGLVLLVACANVAGLLLVRAVRREHEFAVRVALGAGRLPLARLLLTESVMLALSGGALGFACAVWGLDGFAAFASRAGLGLPQVAVDARMLGFTLLVSLVTGLLFGLAPAMRASRTNLAGGLRAGSTGSHRVSDALVLCEVAFSLVLLIGGGLLLKSLVRLTRVSPGYQPEHVLTMSVGSGQWDRSFSAREQFFWPRLLERVEGLANVQAAGVSHAFPMSAEAGSPNRQSPISADGGITDLLAEYQWISPGYFRALGIPLKNGRYFSERDMPVTAPEPAVPVAIINESLARSLWPDQDPVGKRLKTPRVEYTVVGVVGDVKQYGPRAAAPKAHLYVPLWYSSFFKMGMHYLVVRTTADPAAATAAVKSQIASLDRERAVNLIRTMEQVALQRTAWDRVSVIVAGLFGATALLLTAVGVYAVVSHSVSRRSREIGIRIALGGRPGDIFRMMLRQGVAPAFAGIAVGIVAALLLSRYLAAVLFGVSAMDASIYVCAGLLLVAVVTAACYRPARRATRVDPMFALRSE